MTEIEKSAWDAMLNALERCALVLPLGDGILAEVENAIEMAVESQVPTD